MGATRNTTALVTLRTGRVVVGYDVSASARTAVAWAADEAARRGVELAVAYAADYTGLVGGPFGSAWLPEAVHDAAERIAEEGAAIARERQPDLKVSTHAYAGPPGETLVRESRGSGLLVVGSRGLSETGACIHASVGGQVGARALCPVVIVRGHDVVAPDAGHPVVVAVDGTSASGAALRFAAATARETGAPLRITSAWLTVREDWTRAYWLAADPTQNPDTTARIATERVAAEAAAEVAALAPRVPVEIDTRGGRPDEVILDVAGDDAGLIVVGSRGRGNVTGLLFGSVGHGVVHGARVPVAVVRADAEAGEAGTDAPEPHERAGG
jgi:nucleotide-binding universal stress UspA family protein